MVLRGILGAVVTGTLAVGLAACGTGPAASTPAPGPASSTPEVPGGYTLHEGDGFRVAVPSDWTAKPDSTRSFPTAALEVGVPFTGQPRLQPFLAVWADRTPNLGSATSQAQLTQVKIRSSIEAVKVGELQDLTVQGAISAVWFEYSYHQQAATSRLNTPIEAGDYRVRDLTVQVDGVPQFGFRYGASAVDFSEETWQKIVSSIVVQADE